MVWAEAGYPQGQAIVMGMLTIETLDEETLAELRRRASIRKRSVSDEVADIVRAAVRPAVERRVLVDQARRIAAMTPRKLPQTDSVSLLRQDRQR